MSRGAVWSGAWLAAALALTSGGTSAEPTVDVNLVLALDSSASVDAQEFGLQRGGLATAFRDPEVAAAIAAGPLKRIAVAVVEWAGAGQQLLAVDWTLVQDPIGAAGLADRIDALERGILTGATSISGALIFADALLRAAPFEAGRRVIDVSGDGRNNQGQNVEDARRAVLTAGTTINGLAIVNEHPTLHRYFEERVIGGPGAFVEIAHDYTDYTSAIRRKLLREIRSLSVSGTRPTGPGRALLSPESGALLATASPPS